MPSAPRWKPFRRQRPISRQTRRMLLTGASGLPVLPACGLDCAGLAGESRNPRQIANDRRRSITLDRLAPLGEISGVQFISLQKGAPAAEAARPPQGMELHDFTEDLHDFADTAALIDSLDLVISVDTAIAHLAGALGKPVWVLNRFDTDFRWPRDRDDSSLVSVAAPVSPAHSRRLAQRDQPRARRFAATRCGRPQSITAAQTDQLAGLWKTRRGRADKTDFLALKHPLQPTRSREPAGDPVP